MSEFTQLTRRLMHYLGSELHVMIPGVVVKYDYTMQKADVQPVIKRQFTDGEDIEAPIIVEVPVIFPRSGGASLTFPVNKGDEVMLVFADRDCDRWFNEGKVGIPEDRRIHAIFDCVAIPGLIPFSTPSKAENNDDVLLTYQGTNIRVKKNGHIEMEAPHVFIDSPSVHMTGDLQVDGEIHADEDISTDSDMLADGKIDAEGFMYTMQICLTTHVHPGVETGPSLTGTPQ